jgi:hypothetical protein
MRRFILAVSCVTLPFALSAQTGSQPEIVIGGEESRGAELGELDRVLVLPSLLVVIEGDAPFVRVFGHQGRQRQSFGNAGAGPREFRRIDAVAYDSVNRVVWIADGALSRISTYAAGDSLTLIAETRTTIRPTSLCALKGRMFALSSHEGNLVHELAVTRSSVMVQRSLGELRTALPLAANPGLRNNVANGPMLCDAAHDIVYTAAALFGEVHAVALGTGAQTTTAVRDFVGMEFKQSGNAVSVGMPARGWVDRIVGLQPAAGGVAVVLASSPPGPGRPDHAIVTVTATGEQSARAPRTWRPLGRVGRYAVCAINDPVPTIGYFAAAQCP